MIRSALHTTFKDIYREQHNLNLEPNAIEDYMNSNGDTAPMDELRKRKTSQEMSNSMEGLLTLEELTNAVMKTMKGDSSPGCDGFTVNYLRVFWHDLKTITEDAINASFGNTLFSSLRLAIIKLLCKCQKDPTLPGNYRPISLLSIFYKLASAKLSAKNRRPTPPRTTLEAASSTSSTS